jgi:type I restriction enzyme S subunit
MSRPAYKTLGAVVAISKGKKHTVTDTPSDNAKRLIGIDDLRNDNVIRYTNDSSGTEAIADDVLIAWDGANAGTIGFGKSGFIGSTIARLRIREEGKFYTPFLGTFLQSKFGYLRQTATGATIPHINRKALEGIALPDIEIDDQKRIAYLLGKVDGLIARRKQHLQQLDDLLKSVFLEMFSPHSPGYEDWPLVEIKELAAKHKGAMRTGPFGSNLLHGEFTDEGDVAVLGIDNAVQNRFAWGVRRFISNEKYQELRSYRIFPGDVIVTIMGTIGRSAVIPEDIPVAINTKHLAAITLNKEIANPLFISYSIHSSPFILKQFRSKNRGTIMSGLNLGLIKDTKLKRPPIDLQNQFAAIVEKVEALKSRYQQSLTNLESLYGALSQKAFKGELDLSRVMLPVDSTTKDRDSTEEMNRKREVLK